MEIVRTWQDHPASNRRFRQVRYHGVDYYEWDREGGQLVRIQQAPTTDDLSRPRYEPPASAALNSGATEASRHITTHQGYSSRASAQNLPQSVSQERGVLFPRTANAPTAPIIGSSPSLNINFTYCEPSTMPSQVTSERTDRSRSRGARDLLVLCNRLAKIGLQKYEACEKFIKDHPEIFDEDYAKLLTEAVEADKAGDSDRMYENVQAYLLLHECHQLDRKQRQSFFTSLISRDDRNYDKYRENFTKTCAQLRAPHGQTRQRSASRIGSIEDGMTGLDLEIRPSPAGGSGHSGNRQPRRCSESQPLEQNKKLLAINENQSQHFEKIPSVISIEPTFRGTEGDVEKTDARFKKRRDAKKFFTVGRVFATMTHEEAGDGRGGLRQGAFVSDAKFRTRTALGVWIYTHVSRMAVVRECHGYCWCIPINTYGGQGVSKPGLSLLDIKAHAVIYTSDARPYRSPEEDELRPGMVKRPIAVKMAAADQRLDRMSRLNFAHVQTVQWNVKVMNVGKVTEQSMPMFRGYWSAETRD